MHQLKPIPTLSTHLHTSANQISEEHEESPIFLWFHRLHCTTITGQQFKTNVGPKGVMSGLNTMFGLLKLDTIKEHLPQMVAMVSVRQCWLSRCELSASAALQSLLVCLLGVIAWFWYWPFIGPLQNRHSCLIPSPLLFSRFEGVFINVISESPHVFLVSDLQLWARWKKHPGSKFLQNFGSPIIWRTCSVWVVNVRMTCMKTGLVYPQWFPETWMWPVVLVTLDFGSWDRDQLLYNIHMVTYICICVYIYVIYNIYSPSIKHYTVYHIRFYVYYIYIEMLLRPFASSPSLWSSYLFSGAQVISKCYLPALQKAKSHVSPSTPTQKGNPGVV